jgi:hypothetical protein
MDILVRLFSHACLTFDCRALDKAGRAGVPILQAKTKEPPFCYAGLLFFELEILLLGLLADRFDDRPVERVVGLFRLCAALFGHVLVASFA